MDAFESIVAGLLWDEGYWTAIGYKVNLSKEAKKRLKNDSMPRPEIDILAYRARDNRLLWVECKSYLDSTGVKAEAFGGEGAKNSERYRIFTQPEFRKEATIALLDQIVEEGRAPSKPSIFYCLVTGKIANDSERRKLHTIFETHEDWILHDEAWVKDGLTRLAEKSYENDVAIQVAKLFLKTKV